MLKHYFTYFLLLTFNYSAFAQGSFQETLVKSTEYDVPYGTVLAADGNYVIAGETVAGPEYFQSEYKYFVTKLNTAGIKMWSKTYNPTAGIGRLRQIRKAIGGGFILAGHSNDTYAIKIDDNGAVMWAKIYGDTLFDVLHDAQNTSDSGFLYGGESSKIGSPTRIDMYVTKTNSTGGLQFMSKYTSLGSQDEILNRIIELRDGTFMATGRITNDTSYAVLVTHLSANGDVLWAKKYNNQTYYFSEGNGIVQTPDNGCMISGSSSDGNQTHTFAMKIDPMGNILFFKRYGTTDINYNNQIIRCIDGSYALYGYDHQTPIVQSDKELLLRIDELGNQLSVNVFGVFRDILYCFGGIAQTPDAGFVFSSGSQFGNVSNQNRYDVLVTKVNALRSSGATCDFTSPTYSTQTLSTVNENVTLTKINYGTEKTVTANVVVVDAVVNPSAACQQTTVILPIQKLNLSASIVNKTNIALQFIVELSNPIDGKFNILSSINGTTFKTIETIIYNGANNYKVVDNNPTNGTNFYRIKYVDAEGRSSFSNIVNISLDGNKNNILFTNGNSIIKGANTAVQTIMATSSKSILLVYNSLGSLLFSKNINTQQTNVTIPTDNWPTGSYRVVLVNNNNIIAKNSLIIQ